MAFKKKSHLLRFASHSELVTKNHTNRSRTNDRLRFDGLGCRNERQTARISNVMADQPHVPSILRDTDRGVVGRETRLIECRKSVPDWPGGRHVAGLRYRVSLVLTADLPERLVLADRPVITHP